MRQILVVDLEATIPSDQPKERQEQFEPEIVQLGACWLDLRTLQPKCIMEFLVRPTDTIIGGGLTRLTGIKVEQVDTGGLDFGLVCDVLLQMDTGKLAWASWGTWDRKQMEDQCRTMRAEFPFGRTHLDVKQLHYIGVLKGRKRPMSLGAAVQQMGYEFQGRPHTGGDDAANAARVLAGILARLRADSNER